MDAHDQETQQRKSRMTADRRGNNSTKQRGSKCTSYSWEPIPAEDRDLKGDA